MPLATPSPAARDVRAGVSHTQSWANQSPGEGTDPGRMGGEGISFQGSAQEHCFLLSPYLTATPPSYLGVHLSLKTRRQAHRPPLPSEDQLPDSRDAPGPTCLDVSAQGSAPR